MDFTINHRNKLYTFKPNNYIGLNRLSLVKIQEGDKITFDANRNFLNCTEDRITPEVPEIVLAKAKNEMKSKVMVGVSLINHEFQHNQRKLEVVNFDSAAGSFIWDLMINDEDSITTVEGEGGKSWTEDASAFHCSGAIDCYLSHVDISYITIVSNKNKVEVTLDVTDWTIAVSQIWE